MNLFLKRKIASWLIAAKPRCLIFKIQETIDYSFPNTTELKSGNSHIRRYLWKTASSQASPVAESQFGSQKPLIIDSY